MNEIVDAAVDAFANLGVTNSPEYLKQKAIKGKKLNGEWERSVITRVAKLLKRKKC